MSLRHNFLPLLLAVNLLAAPMRGVDPLAARVIVLANRDDPDSLLVARHYANVRGVQPENIIALSMPLTETISWNEFVGMIWQPLQDELVRRKWIDAIPMALTDDVGRRKHAISGHRISYLVVCRGVPLRIDHDRARYRPYPPMTENPIFRTNRGAVDSELSLLAVNDSPINGFLANPLFGKDQPSASDLARVVKVSRLDGPTPEDALALVDHAMVAERTGLIGRAYVDEGGANPDGDAWLKAVGAQIRELGFDLHVDESSRTMEPTERCDAPALYFGWYAPNINGPFSQPWLRFPPGAIAVHIHSDSAATLRSATKGWSGPLVGHGATATVGNVFEPYLQLVHRPDLLFRALARGDRFGDAVYYAEPALSWQAIAIGDPLYRPFAVPVDEQWKNRAVLSPRLAGYVALRQMHLRDAAKRPEEALAIARLAQRERPTLALGLELARRLEVAGDHIGAAEALGFAALLERFVPDEWIVAQAAASALMRNHAPVQAEQVYWHLLHDPGLPEALREMWLAPALEAAVQANQPHADVLTMQLEAARARPKK